MSHPGPSGRHAVRLQVIGPMGAWTASGETILPVQRKARALLAIVALAAPRPVLRGWLTEMLWSQRGAGQARASLRQEIHHLRNALYPAGTDILLVTRQHLSLLPGTLRTDVDDAMHAAPGGADSLALLGGELLEDLDGIDPAFNSWLVTERERLHDHARGVAESLLRIQNEPRATIVIAQRLLTIDRTHEGAWRALMRAYAELGERGLATQAYDRCRAVLADPRDAVPSEETQQLLVEIRGPSVATRSGAPQHQLSEPPPLLPTIAPADDAESTARSEPDVLRDGVRVGVLPVECFSMSETDIQLGAVLAEELTSTLSRFRSMAVVSSDALMRFTANDRDPAAVRRSFGIDFLFGARMDSRRDTLRITMNLLDLKAGNQVVWSRRFVDRDGDPQSALDEIAARIAAQVEPEILLIEAARAAAHPKQNPGPRDSLAQAAQLINRMDRDSFGRAGTLLAAAIERDPEHSAAHAWFALWHV